MSESTSNPLFSGKPVDPYRIRVRGCLNEDLIAWLDVPVQVISESGETWLFISPPDQAALYGAILRLRDLGLTLIAVDRISLEKDIGKKTDHERKS